MFVALGLLIFRLGSFISVPGLDPERLFALFNQHGNTLLGYVNLLSGGALSRLSVFALGVMPYISASIIMQLMSAVTPSLVQLKKEGEMGRRKINQYTRYLTVIISLVQAIGMSKWLVSQGIVYDPSGIFYFTSSLTLMTGTIFLMWLGEQMTERGVGNGISLIIFSGIVASLPSGVGQLLQQLREGQIQSFTFILVVALVVAVTAFVVFVERGQRRIRVNYAQRTQGQRVYAAQSSHLPLKINMSGVIPPIFASSIIVLPATLARFFGQSDGMAWLSNFGLKLSQGQPIYMLVFGVGIIFFAFFYTALVFNPKETADNLKKSGAFVPGIRPGEQTAQYIDGVMTRLTFVGSLYLVLVCLLPEFMNYAWKVPFAFGGTSLLIIVVVIMDFMAQIQAHIMSNQYGSLMKKNKLKGNSSKITGF